MRCVNLAVNTAVGLVETALVHLNHRLSVRDSGLAIAADTFIAAIRTIPTIPRGWVLAPSHEVIVVCVMGIVRKNNGLVLNPPFLVESLWPEEVMNVSCPFLGLVLPPRH